MPHDAMILSAALAVTAGTSSDRGRGRISRKLGRLTECGET
eukprot:CAMPEP_0197606344 /NCGR_PEP_ID=MMETSP1326-20131121/44874_1 /TAXON_ID=1155430 /ORGANISM="Genus nov. species nov., Strain RCC2288" /LENGTH=40 /DNA_ID= /DNA_START= /DNA_END= /DNA_ORIENTATION=